MFVFHLSLTTHPQSGPFYRFKQVAKKWNRLYQTIIRSALHSVKGTNNIHKYHQLNTTKLPDRMCLNNTKHFNRLLRAPKSSMIYRLLHHTWWEPIKEICLYNQSIATRQIHAIIPPSTFADKFIPSSPTENLI